MAWWGQLCETWKRVATRATWLQFSRGAGEKEEAAVQLRVNGNNSGIFTYISHVFFRIRATCRISVHVIVMNLQLVWNMLRNSALWVSEHIQKTTSKNLKHHSNNRRRRLCKTFGCNLSGLQNNRLNSYSTSPSASTRARPRVLRRAQAWHEPRFKETHVQKQSLPVQESRAPRQNACSDCAQL